MRNDKSLVLILLGASLGALLTDNLWFFYFSAIIIFCIMFIKNKFGKEEAGFLIKLFLLSLVLRIFAVMILRPFIILYGNGLDIGDGMVYSLNGAVISETLKGDLSQAISQEVLNKRLLGVIPLAHINEWNLTSILPDWVGTLPPVNKYQVTIFTYFLSMLYYFFGFKPLLGIFVNCLLGTLLCLCIYYIVKKISNNNTVSRVAAVLTSFFPSLFFWSVTNQKDIIFIFLNIVIVICLIKILKERKWALLPLLPLLSFILFFLRPNSIFPMLFFYITICLSILWLWIWKKKPVLFLLVFLLIFPFLLPSTQKFTTKMLAKLHWICTSCLVYHVAQAGEGGSSYKITEEGYYGPLRDDGIIRNAPFKHIFKAYPLGMVHFILEPFPSRIHNFPTLISYPQTLLIYLLLVFFILGTFVTLRKDPLIFIVLFSYLFIFSSAIALSEGNVGGLVRHRDIVTPVFIIFSSIGLISFLEAERYNA